MDPSSPQQNSAARVRAHRARLRAKGLRPVTIWVRDLRDPAVRADIDRQCRLIAEADQRDDIFEWLDAVSDWPTGEDDIPDYRTPDEES